MPQGEPCPTPLPECEKEFAHAREQRNRIEFDGKIILQLLQGTNGQPGMKTRLDRLEQDELRRKWFLRAVAVAVAGLFTKDFWKNLLT